MTTIFRRIMKNNAKHKILSEEWALADCDSAEGWWQNSDNEKSSLPCEMARYAGSAPTERAASAPATAKAVQSALQRVKGNHKKMRKVKLLISMKGILVLDAETSESILNLSIYRISYCSADGASSRVFAVVEGSGGTNSSNESHVAHVFVCEKRKHARAFALSLAHAFNDAFQAWQTNQQGISSAIKNKTDPWVSFPEERDAQNEIESWESSSVPPLVSFA